MYRYNFISIMNYYVDFCRVDRFPAQLINLAAQIWWCDGVEGAIGNKSKLEGVVKRVENTLNVLADSVLHEQPALRRKKLEHLVSKLIHKLIDNI
jgi:dynein heavy chain 1